MYVRVIADKLYGWWQKQLPVDNAYSRLWGTLV